jgi:hypothetical protein
VKPLEHPRATITALRGHLTRGGMKRRQAVLDLEGELRLEESRDPGWVRPEDIGQWGYWVGPRFVRWYRPAATLRVLKRCLERARVCRAAWLEDLAPRSPELEALDAQLAGARERLESRRRYLRKERAAAKLRVWLAEMLYLVAEFQEASRHVLANAPRTLEPPSPDLLRRYALAQQLEDVARGLREGKVLGCTVKYQAGSDPTVGVMLADPVKFISVSLEVKP